MHVHKNIMGVNVRIVEPTGPEQDCKPACTGLLNQLALNRAVNLLVQNSWVWTVSFIFGTLELRPQQKLLVGPFKGLPIFLPRL